MAESHSLTEFQQNASSYIAGINASREPLLITVDGQVQAVVLDPVSFNNLELQSERARFVASIQQAELELERGELKPASVVFAELREKHGF